MPHEEGGQRVYNGKSYDRIEFSGMNVNERNVLALTTITFHMDLYVRARACVRSRKSLL